MEAKSVKAVKSFLIKRLKTMVAGFSCTNKNVENEYLRKNSKDGFEANDGLNELPDGN